MAVVITSKFYQASAWKDISKIVFTSPNMDSPITAGTRSHILPGEGDLGTWYEDTSNMFRIEAAQTSTSTNYYNFIFSTITDLNMDALPDSVTVTGTEDSYDVFYDYFKDGVGCTTVGYTALDMSTTVQEYRVKLEYSDSEASVSDDLGYIPNIFSTVVTTPGDVTRLVYGVSTDFDDDGDTYITSWVAPTVPGIDECYFEVDLDKPYKVTKIFMRGQYAYDLSGSAYLHKRFFGNFVIYGRLNITDDWTTLYTGSNTSNIETSVFMSSTAGYYKYYKISILNNTDLTGCVDDYYALSSLQFYVYDYNDIPTRDKAIYKFDSNGEADILYVDDISNLSLNTYSLDIASSSVSGTLSSGTEFKSWGTLGSNIDFAVDDSVVFKVTTGEAYDCRLTAWDDVTHSSIDNDLIDGEHVRVSALAYCCTNSELNPRESYDPINYVHGPVHNKILKGNTVFEGTKYYYGDFDLVYRYEDLIYGDYLIFKPMLYGITDSISYGVHDFIVTLHYSYT